MSVVTFDRNENWTECPVPKTKDIVHLKCTQFLSYRVKVIVLEVNDDSFQGDVEAVFDWDGHAEIQHGAICDLVNQKIEFKRPYIHRVISTSCT